MKDQIFEILNRHEGRLVGSDVLAIHHAKYETIADDLEPLINQEVEKRIKERMPSEEESKKEADELFEGTNREFRKGMYSGFLFGIQWLRSRLTQKTEGGEG